MNSKPIIISLAFLATLSPLEARNINKYGVSANINLIPSGEHICNFKSIDEGAENYGSMAIGKKKDSANVYVRFRGTKYKATMKTFHIRAGDMATITTNIRNFGEININYYRNFGSHPYWIIGGGKTNIYSETTICQINIRGYHEN